MVILFLSDPFVRASIIPCHNTTTEFHFYSSAHIRILGIRNTTVADSPVSPVKLYNIYLHSLLHCILSCPYD